MGNLAIDDRSDLDRVIAGMADASASGPFRPLLHDWNQCRGEDILPRRDAFKPAHVTEWLPQIAILEVIPNSADFRYRLTGTRMDLYLGRNLTGQLVRNIDYQTHGTIFWGLLESCIAEQEPVFGHTTYIGARGHSQDCHVMMLPWRTHGKEISQIFVVQDFSLLPTIHEILND